MQDPGYELRRITLLGNSMNKLVAAIIDNRFREAYITI
jgi:hypothetical protein